MKTKQWKNKKLFMLILVKNCWTEQRFSELLAFLFVSNVKKDIRVLLETAPHFQKGHLVLKGLCKSWIFHPDIEVVTLPLDLIIALYSESDFISFVWGNQVVIVDFRNVDWQR